MRAGLLLAAWLPVASAGAAELGAWVDGVSGNSVRLLVEGPLDPAPGDRFRIAIPGIGDTGSTLSGSISKVEPGIAHGALADAGGTAPWVGLGAVIDSPAPVERVSATSDPWLQAVAGLEGLELPPGPPTVATAAAPDGTAGAPGDADEGVLALVREWIGVAEPAGNAEPGYRLFFTRWGQLVGTTPTGRITASAAPDDAAGMPYDRYLWERRRDLASLHHCTLGEFVAARLEGEAIDHCRGAGIAAAPGPAVPVSESADGDRPTLSDRSTITGTLTRNGERDEYLFPAPRQGEWRLTVRRQPAGGSVKVGAYPAPNGAWLADMSTSGDDGLVVDLPKPGDYILRATAEGPVDGGYRIDAAFTPSPDVFEPNNATDTGPTVDGSASITGAILPRGDRDHFLFEAPQHGQWEIGIAEKPAGVELNLGVYPHPNGGWIRDVSPDGDDRLVVDLPEPGKYLLRAWGREAAMRSVAPYRLETKFTPSPDEFEPNNVTDTGTAIDGTIGLTATILPAGDRDHFLFEAPHHGQWEIRVAEKPADVELNLGVYPHPNGGWIRDVSPDGDDLLVVDLPAPGKYLLRAWGREAGMRSVAPYRLDAVFTPSPDDFEPNNATDTGPIIDGSTSITGTLLPAGDRDHFLFEAPHHGQWAIQITDKPDDVDIVLGVYAHPNGGWIRDVSPDGDNLLVVDLPAPGKYLLRAWAREAAMRSVAPYRLETEFTPSPDEFEPNNATDTGPIIDGTRSIIATILPAGDRDHFLFEAPSSGQWEIRIAGKPDDVDIVVGVYAHPNGAWIRDVSPDGDGRLVVDLPKPGKYLLRAWAREAGMRSVEPYHLRSSFSPH